jgi:hypothetical protein
MAIGWMTVLKAVPWSDVINNAPKIADGARRLWRSVASQPQASPEASASSAAPAGSPGTSTAELERRLTAAEGTLAELHAQMLTTAELMQALTEQNTQLIARIEANRRRMMWQSVATAVATLVAAVSLALALP